MNVLKVVLFILILGWGLNPTLLYGRIWNLMDFVEKSEDFFLHGSRKLKNFLCGTKDRVMDTSPGRGMDILLCQMFRFGFSKKNDFPIQLKGMNFVVIEPDEFVMGSSRYEKGRYENEGQVDVRITRPFEIMTTEVTQEQWVAVMKDNPSFFKKRKHCPDEHRFTENTQLCPTHPVERTTWYRVQEFIRRLNRNRIDCKKTPFKTSGCYRLPTEAEWELAARGGEMTAYSFGDDPDKLDIYGWYWKNSSYQTQRVGQKISNPFGLYDVHGNVWEWVQDSYEWFLIGGDDPLLDFKKSLIRVIRGGSWNYASRFLRSACRLEGRVHFADSNVGFRLARTLWPVVE